MDVRTGTGGVVRGWAAWLANMARRTVMCRLCKRWKGERRKPVRAWRGPCLALSCCTICGMGLGTPWECVAHDAVLAVHILRTLTIRKCRVRAVGRKVMGVGAGLQQHVRAIHNTAMRSRWACCYLMTGHVEKVYTWHRFECMLLCCCWQGGALYASVRINVTRSSFNNNHAVPAEGHGRNGSGRKGCYVVPGEK